jgi:hypothetical protein
MPPRYAKRRDVSEPAIVQAIEAAGWSTWRLDEPADLLCWKAGRGFRVLECKTPDAKGKFRERSDRAKQNAFCALTGVNRVCNPLQALQALGEGVT